MKNGKVRAKGTIFLRTRGKPIIMSTPLILSKKPKKYSGLKLEKLIKNCAAEIDAHFKKRSAWPLRASIYTSMIERAIFGSELKTLLWANTKNYKIILTSRNGEFFFERKDNAKKLQKNRRAETERKKYNRKFTKTISKR